MPKIENITAIILAGGQSKRMGQDKTMLKINNLPLIEQAITTLDQCFNNIIISSSNPKHEYLNRLIVPDKYSPKSPLAGIISSMENTNSSHYFVCSCDTPFITKNIIEQFLLHLDKKKISVLSHNKHIEPLFAVYPAQVLSHLKIYHRNGIYKLQKIINELPHKIIDSNKLNGFNENILINVNTPENLATAKKIIRANLSLNKTDLD